MQNDSEKFKIVPTETCFLSNVIRTLSAKLKKKKMQFVFQNF